MPKADSPGQTLACGQLYHPYCPLLAKEGKAESPPYFGREGIQRVGYEARKH
jgi:hypothetical protein